ncbi:hypothetical protein J6590_045289 [Homalodisca vitripennis]|nr:hypothetical protein J6590_045289 [Homalodisca vitripennis]
MMFYFPPYQSERHRMAITPIVLLSGGWRNVAGRRRPSTANARSGSGTGFYAIQWTAQPQCQVTFEYGADRACAVAGWPDTTQRRAVTLLRDHSETFNNPQRGGFVRTLPCVGEAVEVTFRVSAAD